MLIIKNGKIVTMAGRLIDGGDILINEGKIFKIFETAEYSPEHVDIVIDADGKFVFPGFIDIHTHYGLDGTLPGDVYDAEKYAYPQTEVIRYVNAENSIFSDCLKSGITSVMVAPFDNQVIGGKCCLVKTAPERNGCANTVSDFCGEKLSLCPMLYDNHNISKEAIPMFIREDLSAAQNSLSPTLTSYNLSAYPALSAYEPVIKAEVPTFISVADESQLKIAINIIETYSLRGILILQGFKSGDISPDYIKSNISYVIDPLGMDSEARKRLIESVSATSFAISTSNPKPCADLLTVNASIFVKNGLDMNRAFEAITTAPAALCNVSNRIGSIEEGKDADIVIYDGNPLEMLSNVAVSVVDGRVAYSAMS